jgi:hypothetical protein
MRAKKGKVCGHRMHPGLLTLLLTAIAIGTSAASFAAFYFLFQAPVYDVIEYPMEVYVDNIVGVNVQTDVVHFGIVPPGGSSGRDMTVTAGDFPTIVTFESTGDIAPWVSVSENGFRLSPLQNRTVTIDVNVPDDIVPLAYRSGTLRIIFRKD